MNEIGRFGNLGTPVEVDIGAIEEKLLSIWKSAERAGQAAAMRACSCNLLTIVANKDKAKEFLPVLATVSEWHPSRSIVAYVEPEDSDNPKMRGWISTQCRIPPGGGPQVCCEAITLAANRNAGVNLPDTLSALLVPDLPVYLYWRSFKLIDRALMDRIARFSHILIVDSHQSREDPQNRLDLLKLLIDQSSRIAVRDLNWARITPWRDLIAQFFDSPATRGLLHDISDVEITRHLSSPGSIPSRTLLLAGWLGSRLGWRRISAERSGDQWFSRWASEGGEVRVNFTGTVSRPEEQPGIGSVVIRTRSKAEFAVSAEPGSPCLNSAATIEECRLSHSVSQEPLDEASLLIRELSQSGEDIVFTAALAEALELEKAFLGTT